MLIIDSLALAQFASLLLTTFTDLSLGFATPPTSLTPSELMLDRQTDTQMG